MSVEFDIAPVTSSIIMVAGVGGGGGNAVNHMFKLGIADVSFMVCNTDRQALDRSPVPTKILLGNGLGAGNRPERARQAAMDSVDEIREALTVNDTKMIFVTAGMGGGTGTGAAPVLAQIAKDMGILTVGIVSIPFKGEGPKRVAQAIAGIEELSHCVDSLIVINNEHIAQIYGELGISQALAKADDILAMAAKSIADIITAYATINVDFADVTTVMKDSGVALMGSAVGGGDNRAEIVAEQAINSPLLHHNSIKGAKNVLLNITSGSCEVSYTESMKIIDFIQQRSGLDNQTDVIWGAGQDDTLGDDIRVTVVATGFDVQNIPAIRKHYETIISPRSAHPVPAAPTREVIDFEAPEPTKKRAEESSGDSGFEVVMHSSTSTTDKADQNTGAGDRTIKVPEPRAHERVVVSPSVGAGESTMIDIEESTVETPAWLRRNIKLYSEPRDGSTKRENLDGIPTKESTTKPNTIGLFDE